MLTNEELARIANALFRFSGTDKSRVAEVIRLLANAHETGITLVRGEMHRWVNEGEAVKLSLRGTHSVYAGDSDTPHVVVEDGRVYVLKNGRHVEAPGDLHVFVPGRHIRMHSRGGKVGKHEGKGFFVIVKRGDHHLLVNGGHPIRVSHGQWR